MHKKCHMAHAGSNNLNNNLMPQYMRPCQCTDHVELAVPVPRTPLNVPL